MLLSVLKGECQASKPSKAFMTKLPFVRVSLEDKIDFEVLEISSKYLYSQEKYLPRTWVI